MSTQSTESIDIELLGEEPARSLGERLRRDLGNARELAIAVAFAKRSALARVDLGGWCGEGRRLRLVAGTDFALTELDLLTNLGSKPNATCRVFHMAQERRSFHPKLYVIDGPTSRVAYIGSANLTGGGLGTNFESVVRLEGPLDHPRMVDAQRMFNGYFEHEFASPLAPDFAQRYRDLQRAHADARSTRYEMPEALRFAAEDRLSLAEHRRTVARRRWILVVSPENFSLCMRHKLWGRQHEAEIRGYHPGDIFFFHVSEGRGSSALGMFTGQPFHDPSPLWPPDRRGAFPWRIRFVSLGEVRHGLPTREILQPLRPGAAKNWFQGFIQRSHALEPADYDALAEQFNARVRQEQTQREP